MLFGNIVDASVALSYPDYLNMTPDQITPAILSKVAWDQMAGANQEKAFMTANSYKEEYGNGVATLINIYNATGMPLSLRSQNDSSGHIWKYPWDSVIQNGQWSAVLHVHPSGSARGSVGGVIYDLPGNRMLVIAWSTPYSGSSSAWCQVDMLDDIHDWPDYHNYAGNGPASGHLSQVGFDAAWSIGDYSSPLLTVNARMNA